MDDLSKYLKTIDEVIANGRYKDDWGSLSQYSVPKWYKNSKFGIFIHWGVFSVPAFASEWYSRQMYVKDSDEYKHHTEVYGKHTEFGYKDFIPMFKAEKFDPEKWAEIFSQAGAKYVVPVAEHHDGFQMYKSDISHWNAYEKGPCRDVLGELKTACEAKGLNMGTSSHRAEHWFFMGGGKDFESDIKEPLKRGDLYWPSMQAPENFHDIFGEPYPTEEYLQDWLVRCCELVDRYRPKTFYFDWWIQHSAFKPYLKKFAAYYYNRAEEWGTEVVINYKHDAFMFGTAVPDVERGQFADRKPFFWQTDTAVALNSWGYTENNCYRKASDIVRDLADIVSKNGCLLLNIGPKADGSIPDEDRDILLGIGEWLKINGEAIYGTKLWRRFGEGPTQIVEGQFTDGINKNFTSQDIRFTTANGYLYAIVLKSSDSGDYLITSLDMQDASQRDNFHGIVKDVSVLGSDKKPKWERAADGVHIKTDYKNGDYPIVFKIEIE
ncbi:MAG: alpha-L-fucosidase [Ruminococcaceae bacterium]|nr:alpha-L-fucosidase [Oscillospiraceae bacterium]